MNRSLCCLLLTAAAFLATGCRDDLDRQIDATIRELNDVIRNEAIYVGRRHSIIRKYQHIADTTRSARTRARAYITLAGHYSHFQLDSSAYYCMQARTLAEQLGDKRLINDAKVRTAIVLIGNVELAEANRVPRCSANRNASASSPRCSAATTIRSNTTSTPTSTARRDRESPIRKRISKPNCCVSKGATRRRWRCWKG